MPTAARGHSTVARQRLYQLVHEPEAIGDRTLEIIFGAPGVDAYAFTFG